MYKRFAAAVAVLFSSVSFTYGDIGQTESFQISSGNQVVLTGGPGAASEVAVFIVGQNQAAVNSGRVFSIALQAQTGLLSQIGCAVNLKGTLSGTQQAGLAGVQNQSSQLQQNQNKTVNLNQDINKNKDTGGLILGQGAVIGQVQITASGEGIKGNAAFTGMTQMNTNTVQGTDVLINKLLSIGTIP